MFKVCFVIVVNAINVDGLNWAKMHCASDVNQNVPEGIIPDIGRFPWLGIVQHTFYIGGANRFAITTGVLIHPGYAIAPAEDIARIQPGSLMNNTKFIVWQSESNKYTMSVSDSFLHPEYEHTTYATIAMLQLLVRGEDGDRSAPVLPVCLPVKGGGTYENFYVVKITDEKVDLKKETHAMTYVDKQDCEEFYCRAKLNYKKMSPASPLCATARTHNESCVWDAGAALITRQSWGFWKLLGFGVRGPGCGAPARFISIHQYLVWITEVIVQRPTRDRFDEDALIFRRVSPIKLVMYKAKVRLPKSFGQCDRRERGHVIYKDSTEITVNKNFAQGFFFMSVSQAAAVQCATIVLDTSSRTNAAVWLEHHCHKELTGEHIGYKKNSRRHIEPNECFIYFTSVAFIEFRFYFSFKAMLEVSLYGFEEKEKVRFHPFKLKETTYSWWPTHTLLRDGDWVPRNAWYWAM